jgi:hypothetical protein
MEYDIQFSDDSNSKTVFEAIINFKFGYTPFQEKLNTKMMDGFWTGSPQQALLSPTPRAPSKTDPGPIGYKIV